jgi:hypothetical protein
MREVILHYTYTAWQLLGSSPDVPIRASALLHHTLSVYCEVVSSEIAIPYYTQRTVIKEWKT